MPWTGSRFFAYTKPSVQENTPPQSGVYVLTTNNGNPIYFGEGQNIRDGLLQHLSDINTCISRTAPSHFGYELAPGQQQRVARQGQLILEFDPPCNRRLG